MKKRKTRRKKHRHTWSYADPCTACGAYEQWCTKEGCHKIRLVDGAGKVMEGLI